MKKEAEEILPKKKAVVNSEPVHEKNEGFQKMLIENFVSLQSVMADLSSKLNNLTNQMSKLLELFEQSAKTFMEKDIKFAGGGVDKDTADKLDKLLEQNKIIARGLALLHESNAASQPPEDGYAPQPQFTQQPPQQMQQPAQDQGVNRYQRSISSR
jgi:hypothetical protein